jgi:hypothetical protein
MEWKRALLAYRDGISEHLNCEWVEARDWAAGSDIEARFVSEKLKWQYICATLVKHTDIGSGV